MGEAELVRRRAGVILTPIEVAELLKVADKAVCSLTQGGLLPAFNVGGELRCKRVGLDAWTEPRNAYARADKERGTL